MHRAKIDASKEIVPLTKKEIEADIKLNEADIVVNPPNYLGNRACSL